MRTTSTPAFRTASKTPGRSVAGPIVATIRVRRSMGGLRGKFMGRMQKRSPSRLCEPDRIAATLLGRYHAGKETAMIELTEQQRQELKAPEPLAIDPQMGETYVLIRRETYER